MILVVGGNGYLGGRLSNFLASNRYDFKIGTSNPSFKIKKPYGEKLIFCDVTNQDSLKVATKNIDTVINLSGLNSYGCEVNPNLADKINNQGALNIAEACKLNKVNKLISFSTVHVYENPLIGLYGEDFQPKPTHPYGTSNLAGENSIMQSLQESDIEFAILRLSNAVGSPSTYDTNCWSLVANNFCKQAVKTEKILIKNNRNTLRDFIAIHDICRSIKSLIDKPLSHDNPVFNLSNGTSISIGEIAKLIVSSISKYQSKEISIEYTSNVIKQDFLQIPSKKLFNYINIQPTAIDIEIDSLVKKCSEWFSKT
jgi:UDP-glucose 4-epimerase